MGSIGPAARALIENKAARNRGRVFMVGNANGRCDRALLHALQSFGDTRLAAAPRYSRQSRGPRATWKKVKKSESAGTGGNRRLSTMPKAHGASDRQKTLLPTPYVNQIDSRKFLIKVSRNNHIYAVCFKNTHPQHPMKSKLNRKSASFRGIALTVAAVSSLGFSQANAHSKDIDGDGIANLVDPDVDGDGILNGKDRNVDGGICRKGPHKGKFVGDHLSNSDPSELDIDGDGLKDDSDSELDIDGDGRKDDSDRELDIDGDGRNDDSDTEVDEDGDGKRDDADNELDIDGDGRADDAADESDIDGDGLLDDDADEMDIDGDGRQDDDADENDIDGDGHNDSDDDDMDGDGKMGDDDADEDGDDRDDDTEDNDHGGGDDDGEDEIDG